VAYFFYATLYAEAGVDLYTEDTYTHIDTDTRKEINRQAERERERERKLYTR